MQLKNNCTSNSQVIAWGKAECNFDCYEYNYSLTACKYMRLPTNHIALPINSILTLRIAVSTNWGSLTNTVAPLLSCVVEACLFSWLKWYSSILKGYIASITSRLYSFQPKHVLLPYLSVTMSIPAWRDFIRWVLCHSLLHLNSFHKPAFRLAHLVCNYWRLLCYRLL